MERQQSFFFLMLILVSSACHRHANDSALVARVGNKMLTWEQLNEIIPDHSSPEDSITLAERYINDWIKEQVVLIQAEENLPPEKIDFEEQIENYRKSLLTYTYEQEWINQKLDTTVSEVDIENYYNNNQQNFLLKDYIVKMKFCAISNENKQIKLLKKLFYSTDPADIVKWQAFCVNNHADFYFDEDRWLLWDEFMQQVPFQIYDRDAFLKKGKNIEFEKDNNLYLISVLDYQLSGTQSPLSFEKEKIRSMIVNKRKLELIAKMREDLYTRALNHHQIETFHTPSQP